MFVNREGEHVEVFKKLSLGVCYNLNMSKKIFSTLMWCGVLVSCPALSDDVQKNADATPEHTSRPAEDAGSNREAGFSPLQVMDYYVERVKSSPEVQETVDAANRFREAYKTAAPKLALYDRRIKEIASRLSKSRTAEDKNGQNEDAAKLQEMRTTKEKFLTNFFKDALGGQARLNEDSYKVVRPDRKSCYLVTLDPELRRFQIEIKSLEPNLVQTSDRVVKITLEDSEKKSLNFPKSAGNIGAFNCRVAVVGTTDVDTYELKIFDPRGRRSNMEMEALNGYGAIFDWLSDHDLGIDIRRLGELKKVVLLPAKKP
jgi:hypothetical protein